MLRGRSERSVGQGRGQERSLGFQFRQERLQCGSIEFPVERARLAVRQFLVQPQPHFDLLQAGEVIRGQHLPLDDREVDLHLVQPTGMHRCMDQHRLAICVPQSTYYSLTAMRRRYPRPRRLDWPTCRANQSAERLDPGPFLASAQDLSAPDIPSGQVLQSSASLVLVFHPHRPPRAGRQRRMAADAGLDACLLVRTDDVVLATQWLAFPGTIVQIENPSRFLGEPRISREDPVLVTPRLDRVGIENSTAYGAPG